MDQRRLKVGDIVDDYCPRERRLTDHAIVAMIDETIRQTRCTACDNEHPYKEARTPRPRRKTSAALYQEVLTNVTEGAAPAPAPVPVPPAAARPADIVADAPAVSEGETAAPEPDAAAPPVDEGPVHRPLIRATLPRPQGDTPAARPIPEFTVRQSGGRGRFREDFRGGFRNAGSRNAAGHQGQGRQGRSGGGNQQSRGRHHGRPTPHKKRSR